MVAATPDRPSAGDSVKKTSDWVQPGTAEADVTGAVRSILTPGAEVAAPLEFPARSATDFVATRPVPSPVSVESAQAPGPNPEPPVSAHVQWIVTSALYQPAALGEVA